MPCEGSRERGPCWLLTSRAGAQEPSPSASSDPPLHFPLWKRNARPFPFGHRDSRGRLRTLSASTAQNPHATVSRRPPLPTAGPDSPLTSWNGVSHPGLRPQVQLRRVLLKTTVKGKAGLGFYNVKQI